VTFIR